MTPVSVGWFLGAMSLYDSPDRLRIVGEARAAFARDQL
jgi:hypothetical protein